MVDQDKKFEQKSEEAPSDISDLVTTLNSIDTSGDKPPTNTVIAANGEAITLDEKNMELLKKKITKEKAEKALGSNYYKLRKRD